jgi:long-chain acyl-CoA synthetase
MAIEATVQPFDTGGIERDADGVAHYSGLPRSLVAMLRTSVRAAPHEEALAELGGPRLTFQQLWDAAARVAGGLRALGVQPGDRVANRLPNGVDWVLAFFGAQLAGAVVVPVNTRLSEAEVRYVVEDSGSRYVFEPGAALPNGTPLTVEDAGPGDLAAIFYTSGTTGFPKGAMTSHANFLSNIETAIRCLRLDRDRPRDFATLVSVPLFHVTGCNSQLLVMLALGGRTVVMPAFDVQTFLHATVQERISTLVTVPAIYWLAISQPNFADFDMSGVSTVTYGGAPIAPDLVRRLQQKFPHARVGNGFGLTETSSIATFLPHEYAAEHADSVGFAAPVVDLDLDMPDPATGVGELLIRGPNVVSGYWNKPGPTQETFTNRWLHSGDLTRIDSDGLTFIVDRMKDMINRGGENVYSVEVENVLAGAPGVHEAAVVGVPDPVMGEKVGAVIVPTPGTALDPDAVLGYARQHLADFKVPQYLAVSEQPLPRNPAGKLLKPPLRKQTDWGRPLR